uniref:CWH43-like N-terminal domain-containing protein n=1 Tax=Parascaris equorum TaxID=6256 RepID=A0A914RTT8_PAREQ
STYVFAVWRGDVDPVFPYISAEGDHRPESCFFSMMLNFVHMHPLYANRRIGVIRSLFAIVAVTSFFGYELHCISAMAEWLLAVCNVAFLLSYSRDFEKIQVELGVQPLVAHLDQSPLWRSAADLGSISG